MSSLAIIKNFLLDITFPRRCVQCAILMPISTSSGRYICDSCFTTLQTNTLLRCAFCSTQTVYGQTCPICRHDHHLDQLFVAASYDDQSIQKIIKLIKYHFIKDLAHDIAPFMIKYAQKNILAKMSLNGSTIITPVPLHFLRYNWRGFNQADVLGQQIAQGLNLKYDAKLLKKHYRSKAQADISQRKERVENVQGVFSCSSKTLLTGKTILLIDDVSTTGATLDNCAQALKTAGAKKVIGFVLARGQLI